MGTERTARHCVGLRVIAGIILPKRCPHGGWPVASRFSFQDGQEVMATRTVPCPR